MLQQVQTTPASKSSPCYDGPVTVRRAHPDDTWLLADLFYQLSAQTRYLRYFQPVPLSLAAAWAEGRRMARRPAAHGLTLIATIASGVTTEAIGVAEVACDPRVPTRAELAVLVRDDQQGRGIGATLLRELVSEAQRRGIHELHADLLPENRRALRLLRRLQAPVATRFDAGSLHAVIRLL